MRPDTGFDAAVLVSKVGDSISCSSNNTIHGTGTITVHVPLQQIHKMWQCAIINYELLMLWLLPTKSIKNSQVQYSYIIEYLFYSFKCFNAILFASIARIVISHATEKITIKLTMLYN